MGHGPAMSAARSLVSVVLGCIALAACSSNSASSDAPDAGYCASNGFAPATGGSCMKGTCLQTGANAACCGSQCASCEAKGLVSYTSGGSCPAGLCPSADVTGTLQCCDSEPSVLPSGMYCTPAVMDAGVAEAAAMEAAVEASVPEASGD